MSHQIFLISLRAAFQNDDAVREELAEAIHRSGGFILMAAGDAGLVAAFDDRRAGFFQQHRAVETCGGLNLNPHGRAADKLRQLFTANGINQLPNRLAQKKPTSQHNILRPQRRAKIDKFGKKGQ